MVNKVVLSGCMLILFSYMTGCSKPPSKESIDDPTPVSTAPTPKPVAPPVVTPKPELATNAPQIEAKRVGYRDPSMDEIDAFFNLMVVAIQQRDSAALCGLMSNNMAFVQLDAVNESVDPNNAKNTASDNQNSQRKQLRVNKIQYCEIVSKFFHDTQGTFYDPLFFVSDKKNVVAKDGVTHAVDLTILMIENILTVESKSTKLPSIMVPTRQVLRLVIEDEKVKIQSVFAQSMTIDEVKAVHKRVIKLNKDKKASASK
jgi:hypothetical protein